MLPTLTLLDTRTLGRACRSSEITCCPQFRYTDRANLPPRSFFLIAPFTHRQTLSERPSASGWTLTIEVCLGARDDAGRQHHVAIEAIQTNRAETLNHTFDAVARNV